MFLASFNVSHLKVQHLQPVVEFEKEHWCEFPTMFFKCGKANVLGFHVTSENMTLLLEACREMTTGGMSSNLGHMMVGFSVFGLFGQEAKYN